MSYTGYLILTLIHLLIWIFIYRVKCSKTDVFDPFYLITGLYMLIFVFAPYTWIKSGVSIYIGLDILEYLPQGTIVFNIGYFSYGLASIGRFRFSLSQNRKIFDAEYDDGYIEYLNSSESRIFISRFAWILFLVSMFLTLLFNRLRGKSLLFLLTFGQGAEIKEGVEGLGIYFLMYFVRSAIPGLLLLIAFSNSNKWIKGICAYVLVSVCMASGSRNLAICVVLSIVVYMYISQHKRPKGISVALGIVLLYLFVTLMGLFRNSIRAGNDIDYSAVNSESMYNAFMYNVNIFYPFYSVVGMTQDGFISCHYGLGILNILIQFIPRAIWPNKPATIGQTAFIAMYGSDRGGAAYPNIGEFYYETGLFGMIIFMFAFGYIVRNAYIRSKESNNRIVLIMFAILYGGLMQLVCRGHFASWAFELVFMWGPLFWLNSRMKKRYLKSLRYR